MTISLLSSLAILTAACSGQGAKSLTGPSAVTGLTLPPSSGATISGTVVTTGATTRSTTGGGGLTVTVTGTSSASPVDGAGRFMLQNVPPGRVDLHFVGAGVDAHLVLDNVAEHQTITIIVRVSGSSAELEGDEREDPNQNVEVEGIVTGVNAGGLMVGGRAVTVTSSTMIVHGDTRFTLADIHVGDRVHVRGMVAAGAAGPGAPIVATKIEVQRGQETPGNRGEDVELRGTIAAGSLSGSCAAHTLSFSIGTTKVTTNAATEFKGLACDGLVAGTGVEVKGARQADLSILASRVEAENEEKDAEVELKGTVSAKGGTCPAITFTLGAVVVTTSATTEFKDVTCATLANGDKVEVKGTKQSTGGVLASRVEKES